jgi:hypothetical protein
MANTLGLYRCDWIRKTTVKIWKIFCYRFTIFLQGLRILGFPCNQFGGQEPGTDEEIKVDSDRNNCLKTVLFDPGIRDGKSRIRDPG